MDLSQFAYLLGGTIAAVFSFMDVLDNSSFYRIKIAFLPKISFALLNSLICMGTLYLLWENPILESFTNPISKGIYVGLGYTVLLKSNMISIERENFHEAWGPHKIYLKASSIFYEIIEKETRDYIQKTKKKIVQNYSKEDIYAFAMDCIDSSPHLAKEENSIIKQRYKDKLEKISEDKKSNDELIAKTLVQFIMDYFPGSERHLLK